MFSNKEQVNVERTTKKLSIRDALRLEVAITKDVERATKYLQAIEGFSEDDAKYDVHKTTITKIRHILEEAKRHLDLVTKTIDGEVIEMPLEALEYKGWDKNIEREE